MIQSNKEYLALSIDIIIPAMDIKEVYTCIHTASILEYTFPRKSSTEVEKYTLTVRKRDSSCAFIESKRAAWKTPRPDLVTVHGSCDLESEIIRISRARQSVVTECLSYTP